MTFKHFATALAASALVAAPVAAAPAPANPAASLSVARAASPAARASRIAEGSTATIISIGILAAFTAVVLATTGGDDDSDSN